jgi:hypothetical protein
VDSFADYLKKRDEEVTPIDELPNKNWYRAGFEVDPLDEKQP